LDEDKSNGSKQRCDNLSPVQFPINMMPFQLGGVYAFSDVIKSMPRAPSAES